MDQSASINPLVLISSLLSSWLMTWAYKSPRLQWINKTNVRGISIAFQSVITLVVLWASGDLNAQNSQTAIQSLLEVLYNAFLSSSMGVAVHEWSKPTEPPADET